MWLCGKVLLSSVLGPKKKKKKRTKKDEKDDTNAGVPKDCYLDIKCIKCTGKGHLKNKR